MKKYEIKAEIRVELTQEDIDDIMVGALEGGITYWCSEASPEGGEYLGEYASEQISRGGTLLLYDFEEEAYRKLDLEKFLNGFKLWVENGGDQYGAVQGQRWTVATSTLAAPMPSSSTPCLGRWFTDEEAQGVRPRYGYGLRSHRGWG